MKLIFTLLILISQISFAESYVDKEEVRRVIKRNLRSFKTCYQNELKNSPDISGKVVLEFAIGGEGEVTATKVKSTTLNNQAAEECMINVAKVLKFPKPLKGKTAVIVYPFVFAKNSARL